MMYYYVKELLTTFIKNVRIDTSKLYWPWWHAFVFSVLEPRPRVTVAIVNELTRHRSDPARNKLWKDYISFVLPTRDHHLMPATRDNKMDFEISILKICLYTIQGKPKRRESLKIYLLIK